MLTSHAHGLGKNFLATSSSSQDSSTRRAKVSLVEEDIDFDFSFLGSGPTQPSSSSLLPTGLELATAKASLQHFFNMNLSTIGAMEKSIVLCAVSILKNSPEFLQSPVYGTLNTLPSMFSAFQDSSATCSDTLIQLGQFKAQKETLNGMIHKRKITLST